MATLERLDPSYQPWTPSTAGMTTQPDTVEAYHGRHRKGDERRRLSLSAMFHSARHRAH